MNETTEKADHHITVPTWMKIGMYSICCVPILAAIFIFFQQALWRAGGIAIAVVVWIPISITFMWLLGRLYSLCSIELSSEGVNQSFVSLGKRTKHVHLPWDRVQQVKFSHLSYYFFGPDGSKLELHTALFSNAQTTIRDVRALLPERLRLQLDSASD